MSIASGLSLFVVIAVPFVSSGVAVVLVVVALLPALVAAALEVGLVSELELAACVQDASARPYARTMPGACGGGLALTDRTVRRRRVARCSGRPPRPACLTNCGLDRIFRAACDARPAVPD